MDPYAVLNISQESDDATVRDAYLNLVRRYPPEQHPERFTQINRAYETIKDADSRLRHLLFPEAPGFRSPFEAVRNHFRQTAARPPLTHEWMKGYLRQCAMK